MPIMSERLVPTGEAAKAIGVGRSTLARWWAEGLVEPALITPGGHARWDVPELIKQLRGRRSAD